VEGAYEWTGKRVLLTGASSGIGAALARELAQARAIVGMCARRADLLDRVLADCQRNSAESRSWTVDLSDIDGVDTFAAAVTDAFGGVDVLVNNAALSNYHSGVLDTPWEDLDYMMRVNYLSPVRLTRAILPGMLEQGSGTIVTVSSMAAKLSPPGESAYVATKCAISGYFEALFAEYGSRGIGIHLVYPALINVTSDEDGDDALADTATAGELIPSPVMARAIMRQVERGDLELYMPQSAGDMAAARSRDLMGSIAMMASWYERGAQTTASS